MKILFRVDADTKIGLGHYFRTINLANGLHYRGHEIHFSFAKSKFWNKKSKSFPYFLLELNEDITKQEDELSRYISRNDIEVFFADGNFNFSSSFIKAVKAKSRIFFYQNLTLSRYFADVYILPSIHQRRSFFENFLPDTIIHRGLEYFTFHPKILELEQKKDASEIVKRVGIISGGSDPNNTLLKIYDCIDFALFPNIVFNLYYGSSYKYIDLLPKSENMIRVEPFNHEEVLENDLLISAFGVSTYEMMYLGMPIIGYGHQEANAIALDYLAQKKESISSLGEIKKITPPNFNKALEQHVYDYDLRRKLSKNGKNTLDLEGVNRIIKIIESNK